MILTAKTPKSRLWRTHRSGLTREPPIVVVNVSQYELRLRLAVLDALRRGVLGEQQEKQRHLEMAKRKTFKSTQRTSPKTRSAGRTAGVRRAWVLLACRREQQSHHLSADGAVDGPEPGSVPPVGYNTGACAPERGTCM